MATHDIDTLQIEIEASSDEATKKIQALTRALRRLKKELAGDVNATGVSKELKDLASGADVAEKKMKSAGSGAAGAALKFGVLYATLKRVGNTMAGWIQESNDYVENLNLFTVAMGDAAEEAKLYAEEVQNALGIDPSEWMRNQGMFKQITTGFGVAGEKANLMSKNLTQLGYDISSFYNISIEEAMNKLQSGIAGELEPLRRLGYALDVATLQQVAYDHGITQSVNSMTQAQKSQLRYLAIMEQSGNAMGDLARTVQTPANALRILKQQVTQLARALGNLLIPALQTILPIAQAVVEVATEAVQRLAELAGFVLPEIDYSGLDGVTNGATDAEGALNGATDAAKELKKATLGIDELNILGDNKDSDDSGTGNFDLGLDLPEYDFLKDAKKSIDELKGKAEDLLNIVTSVGAVIAAWKVTGAVISGVTNLKKQIGSAFSKPQKISVGIALVVAGATLSFDAGYDIGYDGGTKLDIVKAALGPVATGIGGAVLGNMIVPGVGAVVGAIGGIAIGLLAELVGMHIGHKKGLVDAFWASEDGKYLTGLAAEIESNLSATANLRIKISSLDGMIDEDTMAKISTAKQLVGDIFAIDSKDNLTAAEIEIIKGKIETLNGLGLGELGLQFDDLTGHVTGTKKEILANIDALMQQYKVEALKEQLIEAYKAEYEAEQLLNDATLNNSELSGELAQRRRDLATAEQELLDVQIAMGKELAENPWSDPRDTIEKYSDAMEEAKAKVEAAKTALAETEEEQKLATQAVRDARDAYNEAKTAVENLETALKNISTTYATAGDKTGKFKKHFDNLASSIGSANREIKELKASLGSEDPLLKIPGKNGGNFQVSLDAYASGGFPEHGEMFVAREAGPEMVGRIGSRTAVANNDQIVAAVSDGVYQAVLAATKSAGSRQANGGQQVVKVYLDSKEITARQNQVNRAYGR